jgi:Holliday junction resolvasome RuvABC endonuclease subunit
MNTHRQVGKTVANIPPIFGDVGKLESDRELQAHTNQEDAALSANWQVGSAANLPTSPDPHGCWVFDDSEVGENSPSYYVGEGTDVPSDLRGGSYGGSDGKACPGGLPSILALDLGTTTGWALRGLDGTICSSSEAFKPQRFEGGGMRYLRFKRWLTEIKQSCDGIDAVFFEEVRRHAGVDAAHAYGGFMAHLTAWCEHHKIPYQGVPVGTIKKHATGKGNASKDEMVGAMRQRGFQPGDDNEADALAILLWAIETQEV